MAASVAVAMSAAIALVLIPAIAGASPGSARAFGAGMSHAPGGAGGAMGGNGTNGTAGPQDENGCGWQHLAGGTNGTNATNGTGFLNNGLGNDSDHDHDCNEANPN